jgi:hypothetical protein
MGGGGSSVAPRIQRTFVFSREQVLAMCIRWLDEDGTQ